MMKKLSSWTAQVEEKLELSASRTPKGLTLCVTVGADEYWHHISSTEARELIQQLNALMESKP